MTVALLVLTGCRFEEPPPIHVEWGDLHNHTNLSFDGCEDAANGCVPDAVEPVSLAVVVELDEFLYALVVDAVEEVVSFDTAPSEIRADLLTGWARAALGMVETSAGPALVLDPVKLIEGPAKRKAA